MRSLADIEEDILRRWRREYGHLNYLPQRLPDGTYTPGIGHTGAQWPQGTGHDFCWRPEHCISCGCGPKGPCDSHKNLAYIQGWRPEPPDGDLE